MIFDVDGIESKIGYTFKDKMILRKCFTHSSYANEHGGENNELLEFFGDSIIEYVVTEYLYKNAYGDEGKLTEKRKDMVSKEPLTNAVINLGIMDYMLLGKGLKNNVGSDDKLVSSLFEAICAGIYLDGGIKEVKRFIKNTIILDFEKHKKLNDKGFSDDAKNAFQEYVQKNKKGTISYQTISKSGPAHMPEFRVGALLNGVKLAEGKGKSKKDAEKVAAEKALKALKKKEGKNK